MQSWSLTRCSRQQTYLFVPGTANAVDMKLFFMSGDVSAVTAAVESVKQDPPCDIILAAVISNPSEETVRLVEEDAATHHFA